jgi:hypothetical protein
MDAENPVSLAMTRLTALVVAGRGIESTQSPMV